jgi:hypothetical protein
VPSDPQEIAPMELWDMIAGFLPAKSFNQLELVHSAFLELSTRPFGRHTNKFLNFAISKIQEQGTCEPMHTSMQLPVGHAHRVQHLVPTAADRIVVPHLAKRRLWVRYIALAMSNHQLEIKILWQFALQWVARFNHTKQVGTLHPVRSWEKQLATTFARNGMLDVKALMIAFLRNPHICFKQTAAERLEFRAERLVHNPKPWQDDSVDMLVESLLNPALPRTPGCNYGSDHFSKPNEWFGDDREAIAWKLIAGTVQHLIDTDQPIQYISDDVSGPVQPTGFSYAIDQNELVCTFPWRLGMVSTEATIWIPISAEMAQRVSHNPIEVFKSPFANNQCRIIPNIQEDIEFTMSTVPLRLIVQWVSDVIAGLFKPPDDFVEKASKAIRLRTVTIDDMFFMSNTNAKLYVTVGESHDDVFQLTLLNDGPAFMIQTKLGHPVVPDYNIGVDDVVQLLKDEHPRWTTVLVPEIDDEDWNFEADCESRVTVFQYVTHVVGRQMFY